MSILQLKLIWRCLFCSWNWSGKVYFAAKIYLEMSILQLKLIWSCVFCSKNWYGDVYFAANNALLATDGQQWPLLHYSDCTYGKSEHLVRIYSLYLNIWSTNVQNNIVSGALQCHLVVVNVGHSVLGIDWYWFVRHEWKLINVFIIGKKEQPVWKSQTKIQRIDKGER